MTIESEANRLIAQRVLDEVWNHGNLDVVDSLYADDFVEHGTHPRITSGRNRYKHWISTAVAGFPYERLAIEEMYATGDKVAVRYVVEGCQPGSAQSHHARRTAGAIKGAIVLRFSGSRVREAWGTAKLLDLLCRCE